MSEFECKACGIEFASKDELMDHAKEAHGGGMPVGRVAAQKSSLQTFVLWGAIGGFLGALGMVVVMMVAGTMAGWPVTMLGVIGFALMGGSPTAMATIAIGLTLHLISSIIIGVVLGAVGYGLLRSSSALGKLSPVNPVRGVSTGILGGIVILLVYGLPMLMLMLKPALLKIAMTMAAMQISAMNPGMPPSQVATMAASMAQTMVGNMMPGMLAAFFIAHLVYGALVGVAIGFGVRRSLQQAPAAPESKAVGRASRAQ